MAPFRIYVSLTCHRSILLNIPIYRPITTYPGGPLDPTLQRIARNRGIVPSQVIFLWVRAKKAVIVTYATAIYFVEPQAKANVGRRRTRSTFENTLPLGIWASLVFGLYSLQIVNGGSSCVDRRRGCRNRYQRSRVC